MWAGAHLRSSEGDVYVSLLSLGLQPTLAQHIMEVESLEEGLVTVDVGTALSMRRLFTADTSRLPPRRLLPLIAGRTLIPVLEPC